MSMYNLICYCCLCLISQTSGQNSIDTDLNFILCEMKESRKLNCTTTQIIIIKEAIYGRTDLSVCPHTSIKNSTSTSCKRTDTNRLESNCDYNRECLIQSSNLNDDPCPGIYKYLNVTYKCIEDICITRPCLDGSNCTNDGERGICVCPNGLQENECKNEDTLPQYNRNISFRTANTISDVALLNLKKCVKEEDGFLEFQFKSCDNVIITMIDKDEKQVIEIIIDKAYTTMINVRIDERVTRKEMISNIGVRCNTFNRLTIKWNDGILKLGTTFGNYFKPLFKIPFKIRDINLSSASEADWILLFNVSDSPNFVNVTIPPNLPMLLTCQLVQQCNQPSTGPKFADLFAKASSKCGQRLTITTKCMETDDGEVLGYSCSDRNEQTDEGCKDTLRISMCKKASRDNEYNDCVNSNVGIDIDTSCFNGPVPLIEFFNFDKHCKKMQDQLTVFHDIYDEQLSLEFSSQFLTQFLTTSSRPPRTTEKHVTFSTTNNILTKSDLNNQDNRSSEIIGLAVGISASVIFIIAIACVLIFLRKKKRSSKKESTQKSTNIQDYIGHQNVAMPWPGDSSEYTDMKVRQESHKYGELKSVNAATGDSCYDVIDANEHLRKTEIFSVKQGIFQNESSSIPCQEYAMLDPSEKWKTESDTTTYQDIACDDYTVLEAEEGKSNDPPSDQSNKNITKNNEKKTKVKSADNATRDNYVIPDPKLTGFDRKNITKHPLKEDTKYYELAKPVNEDGKENKFHKNDGDYGLCQDSDYNQPNACYRKYSEEHVYNHTVDDVYDSTSHNKKSTVPDNTYDYFSGNQTDDDYNIPLKM